MTSQMLMKKWMIYTLALIPVWLLDTCILSRYPVFGVHPTLLVLAVAAVATLEGARGGAGFGLGVGFLWCTTYSGVPSAEIFLLTVTGLLVGVATQYGLSQSLLGCVICSAGALAFQAGVRIAGLAFLRLAPLETMLRIAGAEFCWSLCWTPVVYLVFRGVHQRVGGTRLAQ